ncbi:fungal-specific transcription factor domain-containing protein [Penicillium frequentans]|uniref:Fungal-specific transcription factor domain-containing protein n=1 Tax=Penicillium frequentans TaxID=3151616 RepID=A0AAD6CW22_9EURO|nr:fungal-specific transcription factor domain-containing protein [Penicillium glabrum]
MPPAEKATHTRRYRSAVACQACRQRKVRCSWSITGVPCAGCAQDGSQCIVDKKAKSAKTGSQITTHHQDHSSDSAPLNSTVGIDHDPAVDIVDESPQIDLMRIDLGQSAPEFNDLQYEEGDRSDRTAKALGQQRRVGETYFYTDDRTDPTSVLHTCYTEQSVPKSFLTPTVVTELSDEDRDFLAKKGVYSLPKSETCDALVAAYCLYVHPIVPAIEVDDLLVHHRAGKLHEYNLCLLWSIFSAAANFISNDSIKAEGYAFRVVMKNTYYSRAKCMYRNGNERSKIVLLQSSLLLGLYHADIDEYNQPWYWTGIAISSCQILGLDHNNASSKNSSSITDRQRSFWRRLWWSCFFRDRWLSLAMGTHARIKLEGCDTPFPSPDDLLYDVVGLQEDTARAYLPGDMKRLAKYWVMLISLTRQLGDVLDIKHQNLRPRLSCQEINAFEKRLTQCDLPDQYEAGLTRVSRFYSNHVHLHYQALTITFYCSFGIQNPLDLQLTENGDWQHRMRLRANAAACRTNEILGTLVQERLLQFAGAMTASLLIPAMQTHLQQCKFGNDLSKRVGLNKLEVCMLVMEELQEVYAVASMYRRLFTKAIDQIFPGYLAPTTKPNTADINIVQEDVVRKQGSNDGVLFSDAEALDSDSGNLINPLMEEVLFRGFWANTE